MFNPSVTPTGNNANAYFKPAAAATLTGMLAAASTRVPTTSHLHPSNTATGQQTRPAKANAAKASASGVAPTVSTRLPPNAASSWNWRERMGCNVNKAADSMEDEDDAATETQDPALAGFRVEHDEYIRTPGNHLVHLNEFWMDLDRKAAQISQCPQLGDFAAYAQDVYQSWRQQELALGDEIRYCYAADTSSEFERYRIYSVVWVYRTTVSLEFNPQICHYAVFSLNRAFRKLKECGYKISLPLFFGIISASLRVAVKHDESFDRQYRVKYDARTAFSVNKDLELRVGIDKINEIENRLIGFLGTPMLPPSSVDFLERFARVGQWPENITTEARALAKYCLDLALFANRMVMERMGTCTPSLMAAAALALAIKVVGATTGEKYEPWPQRLALYTGYAMPQLSRHLSGLCHLLRNKPEQAAVLEKVHPYWGKQTWQ